MINYNLCATYSMVILRMCDKKSQNLLEKVIKLAEHINQATKSIFHPVNGTLYIKVENILVRCVVIFFVMFIFTSL